MWRCSCCKRPWCCAVSWGPARKASWTRSPKPLRSLLRIALLLAAWVVPSATDPAALYSLVLLAVAVGEGIDRSEYYLELDPQAPDKQLAEELAEAAVVEA